MCRNDGDRPAEIGVAIGSAKFLNRRRPVRANTPAPQDVARLHLEDIGKVAANGDLQLEFNRLHAVIHDVQILVHAAIDRAADGEPESARRDGTLHRANGSIGEEEYSPFSLGQRICESGSVISTV